MLTLRPAQLGHVSTPHLVALPERTDTSDKIVFSKRSLLEFLKCVGASCQGHIIS